MDRQQAIWLIKDHMEHHKIGEYPHILLGEALNMAIAALSQPNDPLTLEHLREMDGEPVWVNSIRLWGIVRVYSYGIRVLTKSGEFDITRMKIYRRPPEGET